jgi:hypothetical protein
VAVIEAVFGVILVADCADLALASFEIRQEDSNRQVYGPEHEKHA